MMKQILAILAICALFVLAGTIGSTPASAQARNISIKGSDTMVLLGQRWAETYMKKNPYMAKLAQDMIRNSMDAFVRKDPELARSVLRSDDAVDRLRDKMYAEILKFMEEDPRRIHPGLEYLFVARGLERLADHATNIAEDVVFFVQGIDVRHHAEKIQEQP
jgi:hypothetical protein